MGRPRPPAPHGASHAMQASHFLSADCMDAAVTAAHAAAAILQTHALHRGDLVIDLKTRNDLVSQADREAERAILDILSERTPDIGVIAEEAAAVAAPRRPGTSTPSTAPPISSAASRTTRSRSPWSDTPAPTSRGRASSRTTPR